MNAGEAELKIIVANQCIPSSAQGEVSARLPVWSVATMDALLCLLVVLIVGTRIQENSGKWPLMDTTELCYVWVVFF